VTWLPPVLTPVGLTKEVRAISSVIPAVRCRRSMFLSCPLKLQGVCPYFITGFVRVNLDTQVAATSFLELVQFIANFKFVTEVLSVTEIMLRLQINIAYSIESWTLAIRWSRCQHVWRCGRVSCRHLLRHLHYVTREFFIRVLCYTTSSIEILTFICVLFDKYFHTRFLYLHPLLSMFHRTSSIQILTSICVLFDKYCHTRFLFLRPLLSMFHRTSSIQILTFTRFFYLRPLLSMFHTTSSSQILWNLPSMLKYSREFL